MSTPLARPRSVEPIARCISVVLFCGILSCMACAGQNGQRSDRTEPGSGTPQSVAAAVSDPCSLVTQAEVEALFRMPATPPRRGSSTEAGGQACSWDAPTDGPPRITLAIDIHPTDQYLPTSHLRGYEPIAIGTRGFLKAEHNVLQIDCAAGGRRLLVTHSAASGDMRERRERFVALAQKMASRLG